MTNSDWIKKIKNERDKAVSRCINLETKKEQVHLLIKQLQNLTYTKEYSFVNWMNTENEAPLDYLKPANLIINRELDRAIMDQENIAKDIAYLKDKIKGLNESMKKN